MLARSALAAIDFNSNIDRKTKTAPDGSLRFKMKVSCYLCVCFNYVSIRSIEMGK